MKLQTFQVASACRWGIFLEDLQGETVADTRLCQQVAWLGGIHLQLLA
jgi:hypothetical protein